MSNHITTLRDIIRRGRVSSEAVAALVGCRARTIENWLIGKSKPSPMAQKALAQAIGKIEQALGYSVIDVETLRQEAGLTREALAAKLAVPLSTIDSWEAGRSEPSGMYLARLAPIAAQLRAQRLRRQDTAKALAALEDAYARACDDPTGKAVISIRDDSGDPLVGTLRKRGRR